MNEATSPATIIRDTRNTAKNVYNPRVIELSDSVSKMELRREFKLDDDVEDRNDRSARAPNESLRVNVGADDNDEEDDDESAKILSRLPPGTILIRKSNVVNATTRSLGREDSDYVHDSSKDSTETNSSGSSSGATSYASGAVKAKRMQHRAGRSKKIVEVRRNPVRNKKKKPIDVDFSRPRQRLLSVKRKVVSVVDGVTRKRARSTPTPYMNTRSVTRKMYNVGATYQPPTVHDAIEWKEWPVHGMHERPIWHSEFGLAFRYVDRNFVSLDGRDYREIIDEPLIEVVSVDPRPERLSLAGCRRKNVSSKWNNVDVVATGNAEALQLGKSFEACMHGSLHSVLAYCSTVVGPEYKKNVDAKFRRIDDTSESTESASKLSGSVAATAARRENKTGRSAGTIELDLSSSPMSSSSGDTSQRSALQRRTINFTNVKNIQSNIFQEVFGRSSKNTLIFLKPTEPSATRYEKSLTSAASIVSTRNIVRNNDVNATMELSLSRLDDSTISDEALMEMSSIYKRLLPIEKIDRASPIDSTTACDVERRANAGVSSRVSKLPSNNRAVPVLIDAAEPSRSASANQPAEIARILAEYNEKTANDSRKTGARYYASSSSTNPFARGTKFNGECSNIGRNDRTTYLSLTEEPKSARLHRNGDSEPSTSRQCRPQRGQEIGKGFAEVSGNFISTTLTPEAEDVGNDANDNGRAIDLTTAKSRIFEEEKPTRNNPDEATNGQRWLQELIEDTAVLYCAAAGVHQRDVADYLDTLDSSQSVLWLSS